MKFDFTPILKTLDDEDLIPPGRDKPWPMWEAIVGALMSPPSQPIAYDESFRRYRIAADTKAKPKEVELDMRDIETVKVALASVFGPAVLGPIMLKMDGAKG